MSSQPTKLGQARAKEPAPTKLDDQHNTQAMPVRTRTTAAAQSPEAESGLACAVSPHVLIASPSHTQMNDMLLELSQSALQVCEYKQRHSMHVCTPCTCSCLAAASLLPNTPLTPSPKPTLTSSSLVLTSLLVLTSPPVLTSPLALTLGSPSPDPPLVALLPSRRRQCKSDTALGAQCPITRLRHPASGFTLNATLYPCYESLRWRPCQASALLGLVIWWPLGHATHL